MSRTIALPACALLAALSGCVGLGGNVRGDFTCRAPRGDCAPTRVIDEKAAREIGASGDLALVAARRRAGVAPGDLARTGERTLRVVFPAHVDESGTLHDEAVAWTIIEPARWAAELRREEEIRASSVAQTLRQARRSDFADESGPQFLPTPPFSIASPLVLPSTAREAVAGASAPAVEGFDMSPPPHARTPRPLVGPIMDENAQDASGPATESPVTPPTYPTADAIDAARARSAGTATDKPEEPR
jgi:conjugal transfer pilus assembly protein TraV